MSDERASFADSDNPLPSAERWAVLEPLLDQLLDAPGDQRAALLDSLCGSDHDLRAELSALLGNSRPVHPILERSALETFGALLDDDHELTTLASAIQDRYRIEREIGAGGMAIVYLAHDVRHDRKVALKVLRPEIAALLGAQRFLNEIRTTASLQHPHILGLIDSGEVGGHVFYVMAYAEEESLARRLQRDVQLPIADAARITREVASALDYAHRRGVIHRDIKPENILLQHGHAMLADFGIALIETDSAGDRLTRTGMQLGTPPYMSPEQLAGEQHLTPRSDIYALGCVIYEMLTGEPPFGREQRRAIMLKGAGVEPPPVDILRSEAPAHIVAAVNRALKKSPADRFASAQQFANALAEQPTSVTTGPTRSDPRWFLLRKRWMSWTIGAALIVAGVAAGWSLRGSSSIAHEPSQLSFVLPRGTTLHEFPTGIALSPRGNTIVYAAVHADGRSMLFLKQPNSSDARPLLETDGATYPFFSPDGQSVAFFVRQELRRISLADGSVAVLASLAADRRGSEGLWAPDGHIYFGEMNFRKGVGISRVPEQGGAVEVITRPDTAQGELAHTSPQIIPESRMLLYTVRSGGLDNMTSRVVAQPLRGGVPRVVLDNADLARYLGSGRLLYQSSGNVFTANIDPNTLELSESVRVLDDVFESMQGASWSTSADAATWAATADLLVYRERVISDRALVWVGRDGQRQQLPAPYRKYLNPMLSPDGDRVAVTVQAGDSMDIWINDLRRNVLTRATSDGLTIGFTLWTPDGARLTTTRRNGLRVELYSLPVDGSGSAQFLFGNEGAVWPGSWTGDGRALIVAHSARGGPGPDLGILDFSGATTLRPLLGSPGFRLGGRLSPDQRWLAYYANDSGRPELYVTPFPRGGPRWQISQGGAREAVWSRDGRELFFRNGRQMLAVTVHPGVSFSWDPPRLLFAGDYFYIGGPGYQHYDVSPDGQRFLMIEEAAAGPPRFQVIQSWNQNEAVQSK